MPNLRSPGKFAATAFTTSGLTSEFPCTANVAPEASAVQSPRLSAPFCPAPVHCADRPSIPMTPTWRRSRSASAATDRSSASFGDTPFDSRSRSSGPYSSRVPPCVATAPTPARTQGTALPTHGFRVVTATPVSLVARSTAMMEKVWNSSDAPHFAGSCATLGTADGPNSKSARAPMRRQFMPLRYPRAPRFRTCRSHSASGRESAGRYPTTRRCDRVRSGRCARRPRRGRPASSARARARRPDRPPRAGA